MRVPRATIAPLPGPRLPAAGPHGLRPPNEPRGRPHPAPAKISFLEEIVAATRVTHYPDSMLARWEPSIGYDVILDEAFYPASTITVGPNAAH